jgi:tRNA threonylcarbamoyladenosine biosynthesis protein TsaB
MRVLAVDTSCSRASVAIAISGRVVAEKSYPERVLASVAPRTYHAEVVLSLIDETLNAADLSLVDISAFAVAVGPGSFTGLRIGVSTMKGLAYSTGLPLMGVSTLEAWARLPDIPEGLICPILDARKQQLFAALFQYRAGLLERITADQVLTLGELIKILKTRHGRCPVLFIGDELREHRDRIRNEITKVVFARSEELPTVAAGVALLGAVMQSRRAGFSPAEPRYVCIPEAAKKLAKMA